MSIQQTLGIIKPNTVQKKQIGNIIHQIEQKGFTVKNLLFTHLSLSQAQEFYKVHAQRPFYNDLCSYISSNPIVAMVLEKENAIADFRELIGATDPTQAAEGTLRKQFGTSIDHNAIHGSDAPSTAAQEIPFFFPQKK